ncbi:MAG: cyclase family protein, partial [Pseudomonadota bacterium]
MGKLTREDIYETAKELSNWGRWGADDQLGTLNNVTPADVVAAAALIRTGKTFALGLDLKEKIQSGLFGGRWNLIHQMLATGTDAVAGKQDGDGRAYLRYADDAINVPCQASTQ